jgi:type IV pilus assembly protein PilQ
MGLRSREREDVVTGAVLLLSALAGTAKAAVPTPAPSATLVPATRVLGTPADAPRFTGKPISLNLREADLADVLRSLAELSGLNFVVYPEVRGTVTVSLREVPWDQALDCILKVNGYGYVVEGRVVRIGPARRLAE